MLQSIGHDYLLPASGATTAKDDTPSERRNNEETLSIKFYA